MGVQVAHHQHDLLRIWVVHVHQVLGDVRPLDGSAVIADDTALGGDLARREVWSHVAALNRSSSATPTSHSDGSDATTSGNIARTSFTLTRAQRRRRPGDRCGARSTSMTYGNRDEDEDEGTTPRVQSPFAMFPFSRILWKIKIQSKLPCTTAQLLSQFRIVPSNILEHPLCKPPLHDALGEI